MWLYVQGVLWVLVACAVMVTALLGLRRLWPTEGRGADNDTVSVIFSGVGVLYAVVVAFVVLDVWETADQARHVTYVEAGAVHDVYRAAEALPRGDRREVQQLCREYLTLVIDREWPAMAQERPLGNEGGRLLDEISTAMTSSLTGEDADRAVERIGAVHEARQERVELAARGVGGVLWLMLIFGGLVTGALLLLYNVPQLWLHLGLALAVVSMVTLLLYVVYQLELPFSRQWQVSPVAYQAVDEAVTTVR